MSDNSGCAIFFFGLLCCIIGVVVANAARDKYPQAIDVYQGKTLN